MKHLDNVDSTPAQRWTFLLVISLGLLMIGVDNSILYTALPELRSQLGTTETQALWIINAYPLVLAGLLLQAARRELAVVLYVALSLAAMCATPFQKQFVRYLLPLYPLLALALFQLIASAMAHARRRWPALRRSSASSPSGAGPSAASIKPPWRTGRR